MAYKIIIQPRAERDIIDIYQYIAGFSLSAAPTLYWGLKHAIFSLSSLPERCSLAPESKKLGIVIRQLIYGKNTGCYRIIFRIVKDLQEVHILTIRHAARKPLEIEDIME